MQWTSLSKDHTNHSPSHQRTQKQHQDDKHLTHEADKEKHLLQKHEDNLLPSSHTIVQWPSVSFSPFICCPSKCSFQAPEMWRHFCVSSRHLPLSFWSLAWMWHYLWSHWCSHLCLPYSCHLCWTHRVSSTFCEVTTSCYKIFLELTEDVTVFGLAEIPFTALFHLSAPQNTATKILYSMKELGICLSIYQLVSWITARKFHGCCIHKLYSCIQSYSLQ